MEDGAGFGGAKGGCTVVERDDEVGACRRIPGGDSVGGKGNGIAERAGSGAIGPEERERIEEVEAGGRIESPDAGFVGRGESDDTETIRMEGGRKEGPGVEDGLTDGLAGSGGPEAGGAVTGGGDKASAVGTEG